MTEDLFNATYQILRELEISGDVYINPKYRDLVRAAHKLVREGIIVPAVDRLYTALLYYYVLRD